MSEKLCVRNANFHDLNRVTQLESEIFSAQGITPFGQQHFAAWLDIYPKGFFVAEQEGVIVGYTYTQVINCNPSNPGEFHSWSTFDQMNDGGYTRATHCPDGNFHLGVNIGSVVPGAGKVLVEALMKLAHDLQKPLLGMSRVSGFRKYFERLIKGRVLEEQMALEIKNTIVLFYALQCAQMVNGGVRLVKDACGLERLGKVKLPPVDVPDPVLCKYLRNPHFVVWTILPNFIDDPASLNYSVLTGPPGPSW